MDQEKLKSVLSEKAFAEKIVKLQTPEKVQAAFKEKGIEVSVEEVQLLGSIINKMVEKKSTDLSEEDLENISGGGKNWDAFKVGLNTQKEALSINISTIVNPPETIKDFTGKEYPLDEETRSQARALALGAFTPLAGSAAVMLAAGVGLTVGVPWAYKKIKSAINSRTSTK